MGNYLKIILLKKNISQQQLVELLNQQKGVNLRKNDTTITKQKVHAWISGDLPLTKAMARRIEKAVGIKDYSLCDLIEFDDERDRIYFEKIDNALK